MEVRLNIPDLNEKREAIQSAGTALSEVKPSLIDVSSNSTAMETFLERVKELKKLKKDYEELLEGDCADLLNAQNSMALSDSSISAAFSGMATDAE